MVMYNGIIILKDKCNSIKLMKRFISKSLKSLYWPCIVCQNRLFENRKCKILRTSYELFYFMSNSVHGESNMAAPAKATNLTVSFLPCGALTVKSIVGKKETLGLSSALCLVTQHYAKTSTTALH